MKAGRVTTVYLLRHAESRPSRDVPEPDWPLSECGLQQARDLVPALSSLGIDAIYSSPFPRAVDTVRPFAERAALEVAIHPDFRERKLIDGRAPDFREALLKTWLDFKFAHPGGESSAACQARVVSAALELTGRLSGKTLLVSSHGNAIALFLNHVEPAFGFDQWAAMKNPELSGSPRGPERSSGTAPGVCPSIRDDHIPAHRLKSP